MPQKFSWEPDKFHAAMKKLAGALRPWTIDFHVAQNDATVHGSGTHDKTGRHCLMTDPNGKLDIVLCNDRFAEMYAVPRSLLARGRPYPAFLRHLAERGYYGEGDVDALVARRVESLRNPSGVTFEDRTPDGHTYEVYRRRAGEGGRGKQARERDAPALAVQPASRFPFVPYG